MAKVAIVQMVYNGMKYIPQSFDSMVNQTYKDVEVIAVINGNADGGKEYIQQHYPSVRIIEPSENLKFVRGHNLIFETVDAEFFQLVNQDLILQPTYVEAILQAFADPAVGAANGKIFQYDFDANVASDVLDTTGIVVSKNGRGKSRGQNEQDTGAYDSQLEIVGVDGAACMYRKSALEVVKMPCALSSSRMRGSKLASRAASNARLETSVDSRLRGNDREGFEYFDVDFEMYWEDVDLSLRLQNAGFKCRFVPAAVGYHGRTAGSSKKGYKDVAAFKEHHKKLPTWIKEYNYKNHIFLVIKNFPQFYWKFFVREFFMLGYICVFETSTLKILPTMIRQLPAMWRKRKWIQKHRSSADWVGLLNDKGLLS